MKICTYHGILPAVSGAVRTKSERIGWFVLLQSSVVLTFTIAAVGVVNILQWLWLEGETLRWWSERWLGVQQAARECSKGSSQDLWLAATLMSQHSGQSKYQRSGCGAGIASLDLASQLFLIIFIRLCCQVALAACTLTTTFSPTCLSYNHYYLQTNINRILSRDIIGWFLGWCYLLGGVCVSVCWPSITLSMSSLVLVCCGTAKVLPFTSLSFIWSTLWLCSVVHLSSVCIINWLSVL